MLLDRGGALLELRLMRIAHVGWRDSANDRLRRDDIVRRLGLAAPEHDYIDLIDGRDFLAETARYDVVLLHHVYRYSKSPRNDVRRCYSVSPLHSPARWHERLRGSGARCVIAFGGERHVAWAYLKNFGFATGSTSRWGCIYAETNDDVYRVNGPDFCPPVEPDEPAAGGELPVDIEPLFQVSLNCEAQWLGSYVENGEDLRNELFRRATVAFPGALIQRDFQLPRGRVDLAIISPQITVGVMIHDSDNPFAVPKKGTGTHAFDHAIAVLASRHDAHGYDLPAHVHVLQAYESHEGFRFRYDREGWRNDTPDPLGLLLKRDLRKGDAPSTARKYVFERLSQRKPPTTATTGRVIADALVDRMGSICAAPAVIIRELSIAAYNSNVADLAVATPQGLDLYEIKGESDSASRLSAQISAYDSVGNTCTLVVAPNKIGLTKRIPAHWGILQATPEGESIRFTQLRAAAPNPNRSLLNVSSFLKTHNLHAIFRQLSATGWRKQSVHDLRSRLVATLTDQQVTTCAARALAWNYDAAFRKTAVEHIGARTDWPTIAATISRVDPSLALST